jgi:hypothetical protein
METASFAETILTPRQLEPVRLLPVPGPMGDWPIVLRATPLL